MGVRAPPTITMSCMGLLRFECGVRVCRTEAASVVYFGRKCTASAVRPHSLASPSEARSGALERGRSLLQEGGHAFLHVGGRRSEPEHVGLDDLAFLLAHVLAAADGLERETDRDRAAREDRLGHLERAFAQL